MADNRQAAKREIGQIERSAEFLRALNAAAASIQQAVHSETAVYQAFSTQFVHLGLHGSISLLDPDENEMVVKAVALPKNLIRIADTLNKTIGLSLVGYRYQLEEDGTDMQVMQNGETIFLNDNSIKIREVMPVASRWASELMVRTFAGLPAVLAPIIVKDRNAQGVLYVSGENLRESDLPAVAAFAHHISVALQNAFLFQEIQSAKVSLEQQMNMFNTMLTTTPDNFTVYDTELRFVYVSPGILNRFNLSLPEVVGKTWRELGLPPALGEPGDVDLKRVLSTGQTIENEIRYEIKGQVNDLEYILNPLYDPQGRITGIVATSRTVTERNRAQEALHHAQKLESLGILAGGVAHDFNNLLVAMLGQTSLALARMPADSPARTHVEKAMRAAERASHLTRQLLAYSGRGQFESQFINLNQVIEDNFHLLQVAVSKHIKLETRLNRALPATEGDPGQLQQIVMNLIINAAEAIGQQRGTITVSTDVITVTGEDVAYWQLTNQPLHPGDYVLLKVEDDGQGMDEETLSRIFDPFFTTKFTGRGLGLAAVLGIVRGHRGGLRVSSRHGAGTVFELLFPVRAERGQKPDTVEPAAGEAAHLATQTFLIVDDEEPVREALKDFLEMEGAAVFTAANGREGINLYMQHGAEIDLVILDLSMPELSGAETFNRLCQMDPEVRVLLSSGYSEEDARSQLRRSDNLIGFIQKPFEWNTLLAKISV